MNLKISILLSFYPSILEYSKEYAKCAKAIDQSDKYEGSEAHFGLLGDNFDMVNRMVCFGITLGWSELLPRIATLIDYRNSEMDGMLERLFSPFIHSRPAAPDEYTRNFPYFKTLTIFNAGKGTQPKMMAQYIEEWYHAAVKNRTTTVIKELGTS